MACCCLVIGLLSVCCWCDVGVFVGLRLGLLSFFVCIVVGLLCCSLLYVELLLLCCSCDAGLFFEYCLVLNVLLARC